MTDIYIQVQNALADYEQEAFLKNFVEANPNSKGAWVADVLAELSNMDADLDLIEPLYEQHECVDDDTRLLIGPCAHALCWAHGRDAVTWERVIELTRRVTGKRVIVLRGLSGSGKSTVAKQLAENNEGAVIISADDHMKVNGKYEWSADRIQYSHDSSFRVFMAAIQAKAKVIIVDNTNMRAAEMAPYMLAGSAFGYATSIIQIDCDPAVAIERTIHDTPAAVIERTFETLQNETLPPWWKVQRILSVPSEVVGEKVDLG